MNYLPIEDSFTVQARAAGKRIDVYLSRRYPEVSRCRAQEAIGAGSVCVHGRPVKPSYRVAAGDFVQVRLEAPSRDTPIPEAIPLDILYEDQWLVAIDKPPDMVIHPARGHQTGTLVNALVHHFDELSAVREALRPGILHRLDRYTSGVILVAKNDAVHRKVAEQFENRTISKTYLAIVHGEPELDSGTIDLPIGVHPARRELMAVRHHSGKRAITHYKVLERFASFCLLEARPRTGRTHQIRVHMRAIGHPIAGDADYGGRKHVGPDDAPLLERYALHAHRLKFHHPALDREIEIESPLPPDMRRTIEWLEEGPDAHADCRVRNAE